MEIRPTALGPDAVLLLIALVLGGFVGLERQRNGHPAGLRTHILVCVGSTLFTVLSIQFSLGIAGTPRDTPSRIAANIVVGVGFLGAGAIIREGMSVHGLTTAASVWTTAAIGMAVGSGLPGLAALATLFTLAVLLVLAPLERRLNLKRPERDLKVTVSETDHGPARVLARLAQEGVLVFAVRSEFAPPVNSISSDPPLRKMTMRVLLPSGLDREGLYASLASELGVLDTALMP
jgi:putative Mg2+ transporter-C (MgtC) family protein